MLRGVASITRFLRLVTLSLVVVAHAAAAQAGDSLVRRQLGPGVTYERFVRPGGPQVVNVLRINLHPPGLTLRHVRAHDQLTTREKISEMASRAAATGDTVVAAINADFFDLITGENENNQILGGEWWKGMKVTDSPYDTFDNVHAQFGLDSRNRPMLDRFQFSGEARTAHVVIPLIALNARVHASPEGAALFTSRFGTLTPSDTGRAVAEVSLAAAGHRADTVLYVRRGPISGAAGNRIPGDGAVLAGYGPRAAELASVADGDTVRVVLRATSRPAGDAHLILLVGGWPRIVRDGKNVASSAASEEGTISRNAEVRHPRTAIGFSRDSSSLLLLVVDGRSASSVGMTLFELAELMRELGAWQALNFDGGGSTTMVVQGKIVNSPSDSTGERAVGNALLLVRGRASARAPK